MTGPLGEDRLFKPVRALLLVLGGCVFIPASFFEAASQLPGGKASPVQVLLLTTPTTIQLSSKDRAKIVGGGVPVAQLARLASISYERLQNEPLDATALWLWSASQERSRAERALSLAEQISLRETAVQFQLMRAKALAGDLPASLEHLDNALLVSESSQWQIVQAIAKGLNQPSLLKLLRPYSGRSWYKVLVEQSIYHAPSPKNTADLLMQTELSASDIAPKVVTTLIDQLVAANMFEDASNVAERFAGLKKSTLLDFSLTPDTMRGGSSPLTWTFPDNISLITRRVAGGVLFEMHNGAGGPLMARVTNFSTGAYTLRQTLAATTADLSVRWEMQCLVGENFQRAWLQAIPPVTHQQVFDIKVQIPKKCDVQRWELSGFNRSDEQRSELSITKLALLSNTAL